MLAKLAVSCPGAAFLVEFKGEGIYEQETAVLELDVVRAGIFEGHAKLQGAFLQCQGGEGGLFELAKAPFVGVANEWHKVWLQDAIGGRGNGRLYFLVGDEQAIFHQMLVQPRLHQVVVVGLVGLVDLAI